MRSTPPPKSVTGSPGSASPAAVWLGEAASAAESPSRASQKSTHSSDAQRFARAPGVARSLYGGRRCTSFVARQSTTSLIWSA